MEKVPNLAPGNSVHTATYGSNFHLILEVDKIMCKTGHL